MCFANTNDFARPVCIPSWCVLTRSIHVYHPYKFRPEVYSPLLCYHVVSLEIHARIQKCFLSCLRIRKIISFFQGGGGCCVPKSILSNLTIWILISLNFSGDLVSRPPPFYPHIHKRTLLFKIYFNLKIKWLSVRFQR